MNILEYENYQERKQHTDSGFPYNTYLCSIPLDFREVPVHWHNEMELIYIKKGVGTVSLDFEAMRVQAGDIIVVAPGRLHGIVQWEQEKMEYENIIFSMELLLPRRADRVSTDYLEPFLAENVQLPKRIAAKDSWYPQAASCIDRADTICRTFPRGYELALKGYLFEFFYVLFTHAKQSRTGEKKSLERLKKVIKYVETNYQKRITIAEIASVCGFSESHFMKYFKQTVGVSFLDYLNDYRMTMASRMLLASEDKIIDIARDCGFENLSYFNRCFKKKYGVTPSGYRRR